MNLKSSGAWKLSLLFQLFAISASTYLPLYFISLGLNASDVAKLDATAFILSLSGPILVLVLLPKMNGIFLSFLALFVAGLSGILLGTGTEINYKYELFAILTTCLGIANTSIPLLAVNSIGVTTLPESISDEKSKIKSNFGSEYGAYRVFGSFGFISGLLLSGILTDYFSTRFIPILCGISSLLAAFFIINILQHEKIQKIDPVIFKNKSQLLDLVGFFLFQVLIWAGLAVIFRYLPLRMKEMGASGVFISLTLVVLGLTALFSLKKVGKITDHLPLKKSWLIVPIFCCIRIISIALPISNLFWFFPIQLLHIPTWVLNDILTMRFLHEKKQELGGLLITVITQLSNGLGLALGSYLMSHLIQDYGLRSSFFWISVVPLTGVFMLPLIKTYKKQNS